MTRPLDALRHALTRPEADRDEVEGVRGAEQENRCAVQRSAMKSFARITWKWNLPLTGSVKSSVEGAVANVALSLSLFVHSIPHPSKSEPHKCDSNFIQTRYAPPAGTCFSPSSPAWPRGDDNFRCICIFLAHCKNAIIADLPPGHGKDDDCCVSQNRLWAGLMRPACNWITIPHLHLHFPLSRAASRHLANKRATRKHFSFSSSILTMRIARSLARLPETWVGGLSFHVADWQIGGLLSSLVHCANLMQIDWVNRSQVVEKTHVAHYERKGASLIRQGRTSHWMTDGAMARGRSRRQ